MCYMLQEFTQLQLSPKYRRLEICFMGCWSDAEAVKAPEGACKLHPSLSQRPGNSWMSEFKNGVSRVFLLLPVFLSEKSEKEMKVKAQEIYLSTMQIVHRNLR